ncbi:MAG TPA: Stk1 family PASTA domain-containing Ser/Thr kinase [Nocardioides sp.]|jgi:eukaryotic-like serine/threonine-protein kinase|uniref:Stk1 family PASTA domain-containing Ser/Thr kinase n=1 Tax=Nocardioides sp. TaxID=35761 RepID=UPI002B5DCAC3|nr:Stk1 family PASTA domain-containing Ser/Thr kinase [Nocardioides sp.]HTW17672.1 Stk1 family PASTA domain-containing Ser/Thr kinase [Nocardioides sp.]
MSSPQPTTVGGRYELGELLGRGGMAEVRKGTDTRLGRVVAVKRLRTDLASDATFQARFRREAQSSASLNHPSIVAVYDTGEEPATDGSGVSQPYIVMEYVAGRTLRDVLREGRKILPERALEITSGVLSALDYSHRAGIIHRDIKPGNVMLTPSGDVKVMDFGIARAVSDAANTMTQTAAVVGTAQYLSPEQARGETVDSRSDVYSTGCLLYELLTGRPPFVGDSPVAVAYQHVREQALPPSDHDTSLPPEVDAIVMKALTKRLEDRYQSAAAMRSDIERYLAGRPVQATVPPAPATAATTVVPPVADPATTSTALPEAEDTGPRTGLLVGLGLLVIALIVGGVLLWPKLFPPPIEQDEVPDLGGMTERSARAAIGEAGLAVGEIRREASTEVPANRVIPGSQEPTAGLFVDPGTAVGFTISTGQPQVTIPVNLVGRNRAEVVAELQALGLVADPQEEKSDEDEGAVIRTDPPPGTPVTTGSTVKVFYSDGRETLPNLVGRTRQEAEQIVKDLGFVPRFFEDDNHPEVPNGQVFEQDPAPDKEYDDQTIVYLTVSTYVEPTPTPTPTAPTTPTDPGITPPPADPGTELPGAESERSTGPVTPSARRTTGRAGRRTPAR